MILPGRDIGGGQRMRAIVFAAFASVFEVERQKQ
jgi:hypothetical protein